MPHVLGVLLHGLKYFVVVCGGILVDLFIIMLMGQSQIGLVKIVETILVESSLLTKYRPRTFAEVVGQDAVVRSLQGVLKAQSSHAVLMIGPSGVGKTTLARIAAEQLGCKAIDLLEIDAATHTGIDDMRPIAAGMQYRPLGQSAVKVAIVDECHMLSKSAVNSLLKIVEEPPAWAYWFLCTTEANKLPVSIKTRCVSYELKLVSTAVLTDFLEGIVEKDDLRLAEGVVSLCAKEAQGSPRQALANLATCAEAETRAEAAELLQSAVASSAAIDLARALFRGAKWGELQRLLGELGEVSPESVRHVVRAYGTKVVLSAQKESAVGAALEVLDAFSEPFNQHDGVTPLVLACGKVCLS